MESPTPLAWSDWPARRQPGRSALAGALIAGSVGAAATLDPALAAVGGLLLLMATGEALLPTRFALDEAGVSVRHPFRVGTRPWQGFAGWRPAVDGYWLPGASRVRLLRRQRGVWLRCPGREEQVLPWLQARLPRLESGADSRSAA